MRSPRSDRDGERATRRAGNGVAGAVARTIGSRKERPRGVVLVIVLVVVAALALTAYAFSDLMFTHNEAAVLHGRQIQSDALVASGVDTIRVFLAQDTASQLEAGGHFDNAGRFRAKTVVSGDQPDERGNFTVLAPSLDSDGNPSGLRYGLENESARLNLNTLLSIEKQVKALGTSASTSPSGGRSGSPSNSTQPASSSATTSGAQDIPRTLLMALPGMTTEIADAILDWLDADDQPREYGAEAEYYSSLPTPYAPKNGPLDTVEELLLVRGVTPALLFGQDANRNGLIEASESARATSGAAGASDVAGMQRGWASYLTLYSQERLLSSRGEPRINLNSDDLQTLHDSLLQVFPEDWVKFIIAYRQNGPYKPPPPGSKGSSGAGGQPSLGGGSRSSGSSRSGGGSRSGGASGSGGQSSPGSKSSGGGSPSGGSKSSSGSQPGSGSGSSSPSNASGSSGGGSSGQATTSSSAAQGELDLTQPGKVKLTQVLDLIGKTVLVKGAKQPLTSPFDDQASSMAEYLPRLMDAVTVASGTSIPGRLNLNLAPRQILAGVPGLRAEVVDQIIRTRDPQNAASHPQRQYETWLLTEGLVELDEMRKLMPLLGTGGDVYRAQVVGYFESGRPASRAEVVLDATQQPPRIVLWRTVTHLGRGHSLDVLGLGQGGGF
jgi:type II secretory pathway component PulK